MNTSQIFRKIIKDAVKVFGLDVIRIKNSPEITLLGLRDLPFRTIIDVGANVGQFAKKISTFYPNAKLYCFEPLRDPFEELSAWAETQSGRVVPLNLAIGDKEGEVEIFLHENHTPSSSLLNTTELSHRLYPFTKKQKSICLRQTTLDAMFEERGDVLLPEVLIKMDVQGYEDRVISGGTEIIKSASACILEVSVDLLYEEQARFKDLVAKLDNLGYRYAGNLYQNYGKDGHCIFLDAVFRRDI